MTSNPGIIVEKAPLLVGVGSRWNFDHNSVVRNVHICGDVPHAVQSNPLVSGSVPYAVQGVLPTVPSDPRVAHRLSPAAQLEPTASPPTSLANQNGAQPHGRKLSCPPLLHRGSFRLKTGRPPSTRLSQLSVSSKSASVKDQSLPPMDEYNTVNEIMRDARSESRPQHSRGRGNTIRVSRREKRSRPTITIPKTRLRRETMMSDVSSFRLLHSPPPYQYVVLAPTGSEDTPPLLAPRASQKGRVHGPNPRLLTPTIAPDAHEFALPGVVEIRMVKVKKSGVSNWFRRHVLGKEATMDIPMVKRVKRDPALDLTGDNESAVTPLYGGWCNEAGEEVENLDEAEDTDNGPCVGCGAVVCHLCSKPIPNCDDCANVHFLECSSRQ
ncbi:hypothetical protein FA15DRAFT_703257 [Coprinopsis marcescibilis]|uniref:Uncharacterized protein n=1 Tax=Coprinopsis marcescibilis TaxID=230819 RepID=A0A5C3KZB6_COPMA|nr:hypothetical protein FA15DRAFT_703257 [Coprinopsis marcescibilis]